MIPDTRDVGRRTDNFPSEVYFVLVAKNTSIVMLRITNTSDNYCLFVLF